MRRGYAAALSVVLGSVTALLVARSLWPGETQAYVDLLRGVPRYYVISGPPGGEPRAADPRERELAAKGVQIVGTGCIEGKHDAAYNATIARHFLSE
jgi:hypothetical protein